MELEFQLTKEDYQEFFANCQTMIKSTKNGRKKNFLAILFTGIFFGSIIILGNKFFGEQGAYIFIGALVSVIFYYILLRVYSKTYTPINPESYAFQKIKFGKGEIISTSPATTLKTKWDWFIGFAETPNLFLMVVDFGRALPISKRAFKDETQMEEFRKLCQENIPDPNLKS